MKGRALLTTVGATALGLGIVVGGITTGGAFAQDTSTPDGDAGQQAFMQAQTEAYTAFIGNVAGDLGDDPAAVDQAVRDALKQQVQDRFDAGEITEEEAAAAIAVIDVTDVPLPVGMLAFGGHGPMGGDGHGPMGGERHGRGGDMHEDDDHDGKGDMHDDDEDHEDGEDGEAQEGEMPASEATPGA